MQVIKLHCVGRVIKQNSAEVPRPDEAIND